MPSLSDKTSAPSPAPDTMNLPAKMPRVPDAVIERFPDMDQYQTELDRWYGVLVASISETNEESATVTNQNNTGIQNLFVSVDGLSAEITELNEIVVIGDQILARRIVTVSAMAGLASDLTISPTAPGSPALNDYWIDTSVPLTPVTYQYDGADWQEVTTPISVAGVQTETTARATADGYLEGKYTLTVVAGDVVTGMNITSASGPGVNISEVTFQADKFQIYSGTTKKIMFVADAINDVVRLADTLVVDASNGKVYIGAGIYAGATTPFYVDDLGRFSLNNKLTWDGSTLTIVGEINADTGMIGGFDIGSDYIRDSVNTFGLASTVTGGDDIRFWAGETFANRATAPLRISESGALVATSADITGTINSDSGTIGGFTLGAGSLTAGAGSSYIELSSSGTAGMKLGGTSSTPGYDGHTDVGFAVEGGTNAIFVSRADNFSGSFNRNGDGALLLFNRSATEVGSVSITTTTTTYNTTSDRRLKRNIRDSKSWGPVIDAIHVREYEFSRDPGTPTVGFVAQELWVHYPAAVIRGDDGSDVKSPWMVDYSKLVPMLFKEVQELRCRVLELERR